ncbi:MAG: rod-binding protein [Cryobacterium sp.]|nr:rod-binding protein [Oligoflexia bacterium]
MKISPLSPLNSEPVRQSNGARNRDQVDPQIRQAAEGLEAMFLNTMMQAMRGTVQENEFSLENPATKLYRGMLDSEIAQKTAHNNSVGLADQIIAYLESRSYNGKQAPIHGREAQVVAPAPAVRTGGTDESESIR